MLNPVALFKIKGVKDMFLASHPNFPTFLRAVRKHGLREGSVLTVRVAPPGGETLETTLTLTAQEVQSIAALLEQLNLT